jgi:hypothetical protein
MGELLAPSAQHLDKRCCKGRANCRADQEPAHAHPEVLPSVLEALHGAAEVKGAQVLEAFAHFRLFRKLFSLAAQLLAVVLEGLFHGKARFPLPAPCIQLSALSQGSISPLIASNSALCTVSAA